MARVVRVAARAAMVAATAVAGDWVGDVRRDQGVPQHHRRQKCCRWRRRRRRQALHLRRAVGSSHLHHCNACTRRDSVAALPSQQLELFSSFQVACCWSLHLDSLPAATRRRHHADCDCMFLTEGGGGIGTTITLERPFSPCVATASLNLTLQR